MITKDHLLQLTSLTKTLLDNLQKLLNENSVLLHKNVKIRTNLTNKVQELLKTHADVSEVINALSDDSTEEYKSEALQIKYTSLLHVLMELLGKVEMPVAAQVTSTKTELHNINSSENLIQASDGSFVQISANGQVVKKEVFKLTPNAYASLASSNATSSSAVPLNDSSPTQPLAKPRGKPELVKRSAKRNIQFTPPPLSITGFMEQLLSDQDVFTCGNNLPKKLIELYRTIITNHLVLFFEVKDNLGPECRNYRKYLQEFQKQLDLFNHEVVASHFSLQKPELTAEYIQNSLERIVILAFSGLRQFQDDEDKKQKGKHVVSLHSQLLNDYLKQLHALVFGNDQEKIATIFGQAWGGKLGYESLLTKLENFLNDSLADQHLRNERLLYVFFSDILLQVKLLQHYVKEVETKKENVSLGGAMSQKFIDVVKNLLKTIVSKSPQNLTTTSIQNAFKRSEDIFNDKDPAKLKELFLSAQLHYESIPVHEVTSGQLNEKDITKLIKPGQRYMVQSHDDSTDENKSTTSSSNRQAKKVDKPKVLCLSNSDKPVVFIGDVHGEVKELREILEDAVKNYPNAIFVFLGDYIDRGIYSVQTLIFIYELLRTYPDQFVILEGNHEYEIETGYLAREFADQMKSGSYRIPNVFGPEELDIAKIDIPVPSVPQELREDLLAASQKTFSHLPTAIVTEKMAGVHGAFPLSKTSKDTATIEDLLNLPKEQLLCSQHIVDSQDPNLKAFNGKEGDEVTGRHNENSLYVGPQSIGKSAKLLPNIICCGHVHLNLQPLSINGKDIYVCNASYGASNEEGNKRIPAYTAIKPDGTITTHRVETKLSKFKAKFPKLYTLEKLICELDEISMRNVVASVIMQKLIKLTGFDAEKLFAADALTKDDGVIKKAVLQECLKPEIGLPGIFSLYLTMCLQSLSEPLQAINIYRFIQEKIRMLQEVIVRYLKDEFIKQKTKCQNELQDLVLFTDDKLWDEIKSKIEYELQDMQFNSQQDFEKQINNLKQRIIKCYRNHENELWKRNVSTIQNKILIPLFDKMIALSKTSGTQPANALDNKKLTADFDQAFKEVKTTAQQDKQQLAAIEAKKAKLENTNNNYLNNANALLNACWDISTSEAECKKIWQNVREKNPQLNLPEMVGASATQSSTQFPSNAGMLFAPPPSSGAKKRPMPAVIVNTSVPNNNHSCSEKTDSSSTSMLPQIPVMY